MKLYILWNDKNYIQFTMILFQLIECNQSIYNAKFESFISFCHHIFIPNLFV